MNKLACYKTCLEQGIKESLEKYNHNAIEPRVTLNFRHFRVQTSDNLHNHRKALGTYNKEIEENLSNIGFSFDTLIFKRMSSHYHYVAKKDYTIERYMNEPQSIHVFTELHGSFLSCGYNHAFENAISKELLKKYQDYLKRNLTLEFGEDVISQIRNPQGGKILSVVAREVRTYQQFGFL